MFTVHWKDGKVYLVFKDYSEAFTFTTEYDEDPDSPEWQLPFEMFGGWALEYTPITDPAAEHEAALEHGKVWDNV